MQQILNKFRGCSAIIYKSRHYKTFSCLLALFYSFAYSHLNYCIATWCNNNATLVEKLQKCCNKILRMIYFRSPRSNCNDIYKKHEKVKIQDMFKLELCFLYLNYFTNKLPSYFERSFILNSIVHGRSAVSLSYTQDINIGMKSVITKT